MKKILTILWIFLIVAISVVYATHYYLSTPYVYFDEHGNCVKDDSYDCDNLPLDFYEIPVWSNKDEY